MTIKQGGPRMAEETTNYASADDLLAGGEFDTRDVELPDGRRVKVRGLTRYELLLTGKIADDVPAVERRNVATCLIEPKMTEAQVARWQQQPGSVRALAAVTAAIRDLSGLGEGAGKSDLPADGDDGS